MNILKLSLIIILIPLSMLTNRLDAHVMAGNARLEKLSYESLTIAALDFNNLTMYLILFIFKYVFFTDFDIISNIFLLRFQ